MIIHFLFWAGAGLLVYNYVCYPALLWLLSRGRRPNELVYKPTDNLPFVSVVMAVYNEETVIRAKIESIDRSDYPSDKMELYIGSDASTDETEAIVRELANDYPNIRLRRFDRRTGKPGIINELVPEAKGEILVLTDADVLFTQNTLFQLVKHFRNPEIALVDSHMISVKKDNRGISTQESAYLSWEVKIKYWEGILWGRMMGPFGGCYALRREKFSPVPENFNVDDFYIAMKAMQSGGASINELEAICYEEVSNNIREEFRRKVRISSGNFQNLNVFFPVLFRPGTLAFAFFSHKVLRWLGPVLLIIVYVSNGLLIRDHDFYLAAWVVQHAFIGLIFVDSLLKKIGLHSVILRFITHFYAMNAALFLGLLKYIKGIKTNVWQPTQRKQ